MPDAINAAISLMEADPARLKHRNAFNIASMSFDPEMIYAAIRKHARLRNDLSDDPLKQPLPTVGPIRWMTPVPARNGTGCHSSTWTP